MYSCVVAALLGGHREGWRESGGGVSQPCIKSGMGWLVGWHS